VHREENVHEKKNWDRKENVHEKKKWDRERERMY